MANTWGGMTYTNIVQTAIRAFSSKLIALKAFTLDLEPTRATQGEVIGTRVVPAASAASDLHDTHSGSRAAAAGDITTTAVTVTLNQNPIEGFHLTDEEAAKIGDGVWEDTKDGLIETTAHSVAESMLNYVFNLITNANFSTIVHTGAASAFDLDDVVDIRTTLKKAGWPMQRTKLVLDADYVGALQKDNAIQDRSASGIPVAETGELPRVNGLPLLEAETLPPSGGTPESENLTGFVCTPSCMAIAARVIEPQAPDKLEWFEVIVEPETGLPIVYRAWYDPDEGKILHTFELWYGASVAYSTALQRIRSSS